MPRLYEVGDYVATRQPRHLRLYVVRTVYHTPLGPNRIQGYWLENLDTGIMRDDTNDRLVPAGICASCDGPCVPDDFLCHQCRK